MKFNKLSSTAVIYYAVGTIFSSLGLMGCSGCSDESAIEVELTSQVAAEDDATAAALAAAEADADDGTDADDDAAATAAAEADAAAAAAAATVVTVGASDTDNDGDGYSENAGDCNDALSAINPAATETCDDTDNDCDDQTDEGLSENTYYADDDDDGFGDRDEPTTDCSAPSGYADNLGDCDDADPSQPFFVVDASGDGDYATIQEAINAADKLVVAADDGECIAVRPGEYQENIEINQYVTLVSTDGPELTVVNGGAADSVFEIDLDLESGTDDQGGIYGFTIENGSHTSGGYYADLDEDGVLNARYGGGAVYAAHIPGTFYFSFNIFQSNTGKGGGAVVLDDNYDIELSNNTFSENTATTWGGAIEAHENTFLMVEGNSFSSNTAAAGGAIAIRSNTEVALSDNTFSANTSSGAGGAIYAATNDSVTIDGDTYSGNSAGSEDTSAGSGGAIYAINSTEAFEINGSTFSENIAYLYMDSNTVSDGDGTFSGGDGGAIYLSENEGTVITSSTLENNTAGSSGGGIVLSGDFSEFSGNTVSGNTAIVSGGGIYSYYADEDSVISNNFISLNNALYGSGIITLGSYGFTLANNIFYGNGNYGSTFDDYSSYCAWYIANVERGDNSTYCTDEDSYNQGVVYLYSDGAESGTNETAYIVNNVFLHNFTNESGSIYNRNGFDLELYIANNIISGNDIGVNLPLGVNSESLSFTYNLLYGNTDGDFGFGSYSTSNIPALHNLGYYLDVTLEENLTSDPLLALDIASTDGDDNGIPDELETGSFSTSDFALLSGSPAIDAGTQSWDSDTSDEDPDDNGDGLIDMGAFDGLYGTDW